METQLTVLEGEYSSQSQSSASSSTAV